MTTLNDSTVVRVGPLPWNKGKLVGPKPPLQPKHVWAVRYLGIAVDDALASAELKTAKTVP